MKKCKFYASFLLAKIIWALFLKTDMAKPRLKYEINNRDTDQT